METKYKILIILTFAISLFFFTKWAYKVWRALPRYRIESEIVQRRSGGTGDPRILGCYESDLECFCDYFEYNKKGNTANVAYLCAIKRRVRIN